MVLGTTGLVSYWRLGEAAGTQIADSKGTNNATLAGGATLGAAGAIAGDPDTSVSFDGVNDAARATVNLSASSAVTVEFWLKWDGFVDDDQLAMELTDNFNQNNGGFLIDPNASNGSFGVAIGNDGARNNAYFARPSAGQWHHYAFVLDTGAPASSQVVPYIDGVPVSLHQGRERHRRRELRQRGAALHVALGPVPVRRRRPRRGGRLRPRPERVHDRRAPRRRRALNLK